ncbi:hypothetical protein KUL118_65190 [Tenacibaculum sp. KUL118]|nr:hypothetical protein KUL118_65190 [Tenacibaculum sp. KUL118]
MRKIEDKEKELIISIINDKKEVPNLVKDLNDGEMGSISFDLKNESKRFESIFKAEYLDSDNVLVDIELSVDKRGRLYELDFFKINFGKLITYPTFDELKIK